MKIDRKGKVSLNVKQLKHKRKKKRKKERVAVKVSLHPKNVAGIF